MWRKATIVALFGGIAAALGHAPFHLWYAAFPGFVAIVWAVSVAATPKRAFGTAWVAGAAYFAVTLHWIVEPFLVDAATHGWMAPGALILLAGGLALFWGLAASVAHWLGGSPVANAFVFAFSLTAAELLRGHVATGFPWSMPAYIWAETPLRASVAYTGSYGLTALTLVAAAGFAIAPRSLLAPVAAAISLGGLFAAGQARLDDGSDAVALGRVGIVHPNIPQDEKWNREKVPGHIDRLLALTRESAMADEAADLVVWPEAAVVYPLDMAESILTAASDAADGTSVLLGINRREGEAWYNSMVQVGAGGTPDEIYDKVHLVPFGEYIPFQLGFLRAMAATTSNGFSSGERVRLLDTPLGKALPLICYEGIFPRHPFRADARADYFLLMTNDAWFGTFAGPFQHFDQARFRAAEHGLPVVRVANSGVSTVIDRFGEPAETLGLDETGYRGFTVNSGPPTLYARLGDLPLIIFLGLLGTVLWVIRRRNAIANDPASV